MNAQQQTPPPGPGLPGDALGQVLSWSQWEQRLSTAGQQMTGLGWALHVTDQTEMPGGDVAWTATLAHRDRVVATVEQHGDGGAPLIRWGLGALAPTLADLDPHPHHRDLWERDLVAAGTDEETAISALDQVAVTSTPPPSAAPADLAAPVEVTVSLTFRVHDRDRLMAAAQHAVDQHGDGHNLDPTDLGGAIAEVLLRSRPGERHNLDYGVELHSLPGSVTGAAAPGARRVVTGITLHAGTARPAFTPPSSPGPAAGR